MKYRQFELIGKTFIVFSIAAVLACADSSGPADSSTVSLSFSVPTPGLRMVQASVARVQDNAGNTLDIQSAQIVLSKIELERSDGPEDCDSSGRGNPCNEFEAGPVLVNLSVAGGLTTLLSDPIPAGTYDELEVEIERPDEDDAATRAFRIANPTFPSTASVRVVGTFNGQPFDVFIDVEAEMELRLEPISGCQALWAENVR